MHMRVFKTYHYLRYILCSIGKFLCQFWYDKLGLLKLNLCVQSQKAAACIVFIFQMAVACIIFTQRVWGVEREVNLYEMQKN